MTYRDMAVSVCKIAGEELINRAEELIPAAENVKDFDIWIHIPSLTDDPYCVPEIQVNTNVYPARVAMDKIMKLVYDDEC